MADDLEGVRRQIAMLARRKKARIVPRNSEMPCYWRPTTVINPSTDIPFDDISAWHRIADLAEDGHALEEKVLDQPQGEIGYVMIVNLDSSSPPLYIKLQLKGAFIFGRSFHYSTL